MDPGVKRVYAMLLFTIVMAGAAIKWSFDEEARTEREIASCKPPVFLSANDRWYYYRCPDGRIIKIDKFIQEQGAKAE